MQPLIEIVFLLFKSAKDRKGLYMRQVAAYSSMNGLGVFLLPPEWDASLSQGYPQN